MPVDKQMEAKRKWVTHPTKGNVLMIGIVWISGMGLLLVSTTNLFTEPFLNNRYILVYMMMMISTVAVARVTVNYYRSRKSGNQRQ